ncbi:hypothetical protein SUGI_0110240 [Cryptomeria japonica]|nr:hypothetical protein SUGI_0110240 [Cryptomeria japonica]
MSDSSGSNPSNDIDSSALFVNSYKNFIQSTSTIAGSNSLPQQPPPESYKILSRQSPLPCFPSNFPPSKLIPNTRFIVDGFRSAGPFSVTYFLSHFHSDHYAGLNPHWSRGLIFCSHVTAHLLVTCLKIPDAFVVPLQIGEPLLIDGCEVTLIDANHCPGAVQILVRVYASGGDIRKYVHTGDMRYDSQMKLEPALFDFIGADTLFLDTTYCNPKFVFPSQTESVEYVANTVRRIMTEQQGVDKSSVLFLIAAYVVGKEKILTAVARHCNCRVFVEDRKMSILSCLDLDEYSIFTVDGSATNVHVVGWNVLGETWPYFRPNWVNMEKIMKERGYSRVVGFVPTGWMYEVKRYSFPVRVKGCFEVHLVPYSEHSNYDELREYVRFLRPKEIVPTVGLEGLGLDSKQAATMMKCFVNLVDETAQKRRFLKGFRRTDVVVGATKDQGSDEFSEDEGAQGEAGNAEENTMEMETLCSGEGVTAGKQRMVEARKLNLTPKLVLPNVKNEDILQTKSYLQHESATVGGTEGGTIEPAPRVFFGKKARKRGDSGPVLSTMDVGNALDTICNPGSALGELQGQMNNAGDSSQSAVNGIGGMEDDPDFIGCNPLQSIGRMDEAMEEMRLCLPDWVVKDQMYSLLEKTGGDITEAVSEFYEHETEFWEQIVAVTKANPGGINDPMSEKCAGDKFSEQSNLVSSAAMASKQGSYSHAAPDSKEFKIPDIHPSTVNQHNKSTGKTSSKRNTASKGIDWSISSKPKKKSRFSVKSVPNKGKQSAITNFFKKEVVDGSVPGINSGIKQSSIANFFKKSVMDGGVLNVDFNVTGPECAVNISSRSQSVGLESMRRSKDSKQPYGEGLTQLLQILDGNMSNEDALILLDKAKGDVNTALNLYYTACCEPSIKETTRNELKLDKCISPLEMGSNLLNCIIKENSSCNSAEPTALSIQKHSEISAVNVKERSVALPLEKYNPIENACWRAGELAPYLHLARTFDLVEQESGKLKTTIMLCNMFRSLLALSPEDVLSSVYLCTNKIAPDYENVDLNIGGSTVIAAIEDAFGTPKSRLKEMYNNMGDLGDVAQACRQTQSMLSVPRPLSIHHVFMALLQISKEGGSGSNARKKGVILSLLRSCREKETKFVVRTLVRNMRIGAMMRTVLPALAQAIILNSLSICSLEGFSENLKAQLQQASVLAMEAYNILPNLNMLIPTMISKGIDFLSATLSISPGVPIKPMLAKITNGVSEVLKRFQGKAFTCEYKYDGQRAQIHMLMDGSVRIFSRNCEDSTSRFPDVVEIVLSSVTSTTKNFVLDAEVVAVDRNNGNKIMAFQYLSSRERGRNGSSVQSQNIKVDVCIFIFDVMFANGEQLLALSLRERRNRIKDLFTTEKPGHLRYVNEITVKADEAHPSSILTLNKVDAFLADAISSSCEGIMAKALDDNSEYAPSKRSDSWLKVKRDYVEGLHETLDLVPIGAWHGNGRKAGWFSPFLLACYDPDSEEYQSVCRVMSGFSDDFYREMEEFFSGERILSKKPAYYQTLEEPDLWFCPELVWEIRGADLTVSPVHQAAVGLVHPSRGISMRAINAFFMVYTGQGFRKCVEQSKAGPTLILYL